MASLDRKLAEVRKKERHILQEIDERNKKRKIPCGGCGKSHKIEGLTAIQTHYYIEPHGCTGGDYWREGEMQFICPSTKIVNRILFNNNDIPWEKREEYKNNPESQFKHIYKHLFKSVKDQHEKKFDCKWVNNFYIDEHRKKYGLVEKRKEPEDEE